MRYLLCSRSSSTHNLPSASHSTALSKETAEKSSLSKAGLGALGISPLGKHISQDKQPSHPRKHKAEYPVSTPRAIHTALTVTPFENHTSDSTTLSYLPSRIPFSPAHPIRLSNFANIDRQRLASPGKKHVFISTRKGREKSL